MNEPAIDLAHKVERLQNLLVAHATGGSGDDVAYRELRRELLNNGVVGPLLPRFVQTCGDLNQFWQFIKHKFSTYADRRTFLWEGFRPAVEAAEHQGSPTAASMAVALDRLNSEIVRVFWQNALSRCATQPEGAITAARSLVESVCKHVLNAQGIEYSEKSDITALYAATAKALNLAPSLHSENTFKVILGSATTIVSQLANLRNTLGDAHGPGPLPARAQPRHAELAVNLAGSLAAFIIATSEARAQISPADSRS